MLKKLSPPAALLAIALAGLGFVIVHPEGLFDRNSDLVAAGLGTQTVMHDRWQSAMRLPLWRSDQMSGGPALTNPQALYTHPVHWLFALFEPVRIVGLVIWLQMLLAGLGADHAAGVLQLSRPARLLVSVAMLFSLKTILAAYAGWLAMLAGIAALPLLCASVAALMTQPSWRAVLVAGLSGAWSLHAGNPQLTYYAVLLLSLWGGCRVARLVSRGDAHAAGRLAGMVLLSAVLALALTAYLWLPLAFDAPLLTRGAATYDFFAGAAFPFRGLLTIAAPEFFGSPVDGTFEAWEYVVYFGIVVTPLALLGAWRGWRRPLVVPLIIGLALSLTLAADSPLLRAAFAVVPGYALFRLPVRILFLSPFFAACLAGVGFDELRVAARSTWARQTVTAVLIILAAIEGGYWARRYLRTRDRVSFPITAEYVAALKAGPGPSRIAPMSRSLPIPGFAAPLGLELVTGYDSFNFRHYQAYMDLVATNRSPGVRPVVWTDLDTVARADMLAALNVRYVVAPQPVSLPDYALVGAYANQPQFTFYKGPTVGPAYVYRNERFLQRAFFVNDVRSAGNDDEMIRAVAESDVRQTAVVEGETGGLSPAAPADRVDVLHSEGGRLDLATHNQARRFLVLSEVWHPGWRATVDDVSVSLHRTDVALMGVWLPPGDHRVSLRFWPTGLTAGLAVTGVAVCGVLVAGLGTRRRRQRHAS